jgi:hypothetical protein
VTAEDDSENRLIQNGRCHIFPSFSQFMDWVWSPFFLGKAVSGMPMMLF